MLYRYSINKLLNLPDNFEVLSCTSSEIFIQLARTSQSCPRCQTTTRQIHDYRNQKVQDTPLQRRDFHIMFRKRRYVCPHCGKRFYEANPFLSPYQRRTIRCREEILAALCDIRSMQSIADEFYCSAGVVRRTMEHIHYAKPSCLPKVLAIDEFRGNVEEKFQCLLADPVHGDVLDVLSNRKSEDIRAYFLEYSRTKRKKVRYIVMDLSSQFRSVMQECFPKARIVADKFHVVRLINWAMESVRKEEQKKFANSRRKYFKRSKALLLLHRKKLTDSQKEQLALMLGVSDRLRMAYGLKELFYDVMESVDEQQARERYQRFLTHAMQANLTAFHKHIKTLNQWFYAILLSITTGYSNGFVEGCNNRTKVLKRISYGFRNFTLFRNRLLYIANNSKKKRRSRQLNAA